MQHRVSIKSYRVLHFQVINKRIRKAQTKVSNSTLSKWGLLKVDQSLSLTGCHFGQGWHTHL